MSNLHTDFQKLEYILNSVDINDFAFLFKEINNILEEDIKNNVKSDVETLKNATICKAKEYIGKAGCLMTIYTVQTLLDKK